MKCENCGKYSGNYKLCFKCNQLKTEGIIEKCPKCGKFFIKSKGCECSPKGVISKIVKKIEKNARKTEIDQYKESFNNCIVCEVSINSGILCEECLTKKEIIKKDFVNQRTKQEILDHYFNHRSALYKIRNEKFIRNAVLRLFAIAEELYIFYNDKMLKDRVIGDTILLLERKTKKQENSETENQHEKKSFDDEDYRKQWPTEHQCDDGHYVRSYSEMLIDNWLYNNGYVHAYEKSVFMTNSPEAVVLSDFYLPKGNVYIEFFGLNDQRYLERKDKKIKMYNENTLNLLILEEPDVKRLNDIMPRKLFEFIKE